MLSITHMGRTLHRVTAGPAVQLRDALQPGLEHVIAAAGLNHPKANEGQRNKAQNKAAQATTASLNVGLIFD
jgi:hypothetical protein